MNKFFLPIFLILLSIGLFIVFINPEYLKIKDLRSVNNQYDEALNKSKELRIFRDSLLEKYNTFDENNLSKIKKMLPDNIDNVRLIMDIDNIASKYNATIKDVEVRASSDKKEKINVHSDKDYDYVTLDFSILTTYENFTSFISDLKNSLRLVDITSIKFSKPEKDGIYKYDLSIKTYWLK